MCVYERARVCVCASAHALHISSAMQTATYAVVEKQVDTRRIRLTVQLADEKKYLNAIKTRAYYEH